MNKTRLAIIGAGFSGIYLGQELRKFFEVKIFEKSRGCGGRMSTRYSGNLLFDHGAQYFTAESEDFKKFLDPFIASGFVSRWRGDVITFKSGNKIASRRNEDSYFVASPNMNSLCKKLADDLDISLNSEVAPILTKQSGGRHLEDKNGNDLGFYDLIISTAPIAQTKNLFGNQIAKDLETQTVFTSPSLIMILGLELQEIGFAALKLKMFGFRQKNYLNS